MASSGQGEGVSGDVPAAAGGAGEEGRWSVKASRESHVCINPIRQIEETQFQDVLAKRRTDIEFIKLSIGECG